MNNVKSIILNAHNDPCFEDKSSLTLKDGKILSGTLFRIKLYLKLLVLKKPVQRSQLTEMIPPCESYAALFARYSRCGQKLYSVVFPSLFVF